MTRTPIFAWAAVFFSLISPASQADGIATLLNPMYVEFNYTLKGEGSSQEKPMRATFEVQGLSPAAYARDILEIHLIHTQSGQEMTLVINDLKSPPPGVRLSSIEYNPTETYISPLRVVEIIKGIALRVPSKISLNIKPEKRVTASAASISFEIPDAEKTKASLPTLHANFVEGLKAGVNAMEHTFTKSLRPWNSPLQSLIHSTAPTSSNNVDVAFWRIQAMYKDLKQLEVSNPSELHVRELVPANDWGGTENLGSLLNNFIKQVRDLYKLIEGPETTDEATFKYIQTLGLMFEPSEIPMAKAVNEKGEPILTASGKQMRIPLFETNEIDRLNLEPFEDWGKTFERLHRDIPTQPNVGSGENCGLRFQKEAWFSEGLVPKTTTVKKPTGLTQGVHNVKNIIKRFFKIRVR